MADENGACMKRCGFYIRVSTERQAKVEEGSLKAQADSICYSVVKPH